ncbi:copper homeostasis protein CutC [Gracilibacillus sp. YIM 98692]|uniref:copper homeostasis protein CutC n=1 Tax=Gracilibacillus sp. YIM 98692 TaxID=2663532 RepID=UPI0013D5CB8E|nr:copper homeostasis protein CutC [Gracilibacillus sp. YIM 98692]
MFLEVIVQNKQEAIQAESLGVDRLELVSRIDKDGLTPSVEMVEQVVNSVSIPVQVMIRPHDHHFYYDKQDEDNIKTSFQKMLEVGATHFVFGALHQDDTINLRLVDEVIALNDQIRFTFHRAFDHVRSLEEAYDTLSNYQGRVERILTSGGKTNCVEGMDSLKKLVKMARESNGPAIMPGSGLNVDNIKQIHQNVGASEYHFGKSVRIDHSYENGFNEHVIKQLKNYK